MAGKVVGWAFEQGRASGLSPTARYVLVAYADNADSDGKCWPEKKKIIEKTGLSRATVYRAIDALESHGLLRFTEDERGRECVLLAVSGSSHSETNPSHSETRPPDGPSQPETGTSQPETGSSHSETGSNKGTVKNRQEPKQQDVDSADPVSELYEFWKQQTGRNGHTQLTPGRRRAIQARLDEGREPEFIRLAITNAARSPFHQGKNDRQQRYDDITLICRNGEKLEQFAEMGGGGGAATAAPPQPTGPIVDPEGCQRDWDAAKVRIRESSTLQRSRFELFVAPLEAVGKRGRTLVLLDNSEHGGGWASRFEPLFLEVLGEAYDGVEVVDQTQLEMESR